MYRGNTETMHSLRLWYRGDQIGLDTLIERHLPWIREQVRRRMGPILRQKADTADYVQDAMVEFLRYGPKVLISDENHFQALIIRIVENSLRQNYDWFTAKRRAISKERPLPSDTVLNLDRPNDAVKTPSAEAQRHEREAWIRLGMELLDPKDQEILILQKWENLSFVEIGKRLNLSTDAARMRHNRAVDRLTEKVQLLRSGDLPKVLAEDSP
jgi:RNA polymerase sigma-70 factor (ECF subfamily)